MSCTQNYCHSELYGDGNCPISCYKRCPGICDDYFNDVLYPPPPPPTIINPYNHSRPISTNLVIMAGVLGGAFFLGVCWILVLNFYAKWKTSRRRRRMVNSSILNDTRDDVVDGNHGPVVEHHIWYINTVGLQQSVIDSITVCKYRKDEGLIEGTDCSVCLSEFEPDETLRLLPKCSHAFHLPCIDTWLRSHTNCPLCRAPVVVHVSRINSLENLESFGDLDSREGSSDQMESLHVGENGTSEVRSRSGDFDSCPIEIGRLSNFVKGNSPHVEGRNSAVRVQSDLGNNRRVLEQLEHEMQPVRRSVSLDLSSASVIYGAMANVGGQEGSSHSHSELVQVNNENSSGSSSLFKMMKSSSIGRSLQKKPSSSMKRSFSSSGKLLVPKHSRSKTSILPF